jgi:hypothetical protein
MEDGNKGEKCPSKSTSRPIRYMVMMTFGRKNKKIKKSRPMSG